MTDTLEPASSREDPRLRDLSEWVRRVAPAETFVIEPASADASFRRYFRVTLDGQTRIVMDAPPPQEDCRPFVHVAGLLAAAGVHAPEVLAQDLGRGFLLLTDLGSRTYLDVLDAENAAALFGDAIAALVRWQLATRPGELPPYDEALLRRELALFPDWYVARHLRRTMTPAQQESLQAMFTLIVRSNLAQPTVFVHRDYMPRNLMLSDPNPGVLDFQDAVVGPISYDIASLMRDAFLSWEEEQVIDWTVRYWERARRAGLPVPADFGEFYRDFEWMGLQRHLKVLGIFARINYRDGKPKYLADTPRFLGYVRKVAGRYAALKPLLRLMDELDPCPVEVAYTF
ncbi:MAG: phosphotransferase [Gammaproteobacteria bacterium]